MEVYFWDVDLLCLPSTTKTPTFTVTYEQKIFFIHTQPEKNRACKAFFFQLGYGNCNSSVGIIAIYPQVS